MCVPVNWATVLFPEAVIVVTMRVNCCVVFQDAHPGHKATVDTMIDEFKKDLKTKINPRNLQKFVETFL
jgi:hypothetical protein